MESINVNTLCKRCNLTLGLWVLNLGIAWLVLHDFLVSGCFFEAGPPNGERHPKNSSVWIDGIRGCRDYTQKTCLC